MVRVSPQELRSDPEATIRCALRAGHDGPHQKGIITWGESRMVKDPRCGPGCVMPVIDFDSGTDATYVCGQEQHGSSICVLHDLTEGKG
jgi:hypothetical protein